MYAADERAFSLAQDMVRGGEDKHLAPVERPFVYLVYEHREVLEDVTRSVEFFKELEGDVPEANRAPFEEFTLWATKHCEVIERFGRYPHRNGLLGRASTDEERAFLTQPGSHF